METAVVPTHTVEDLARAAELAVASLAAGEVVVLPTETVYGLAGDALHPGALAKIFEAKERPFFDPLICHLPSLAWLDRMTRIPDESRPLVDALTTRFWPGPLTLVLPRSEIVPDLVTSGMETVAVRMSVHPVFSTIVQRFGKPLAAPSANRFGRISPTAAEHAFSELEGRIPLIVDGGPTAFGIESTIVAVEGAHLRILRAGPITSEDLVEAWGKYRATCEIPPTREEVEAFFATLQTVRKEKPEAPGQLESHYAPRTPMHLLPIGGHLRATEGIRIGSLAWESPSEDGPFAHEEVLSPGSDLREAAATLFAKMRRLDEAGLDLIVAQSVPEEGLGVAIMDRLRKAAARRGRP